MTAMPWSVLSHLHAQMLWPSCCICNDFNDFTILSPGL